MEFRPFHVEHLRVLKPQAAQARDLTAVRRVLDEVGYLYTAGVALSAFHEARMLGCAGVIPLTPYKAAAWAFLSDISGEHMLAITRKVRSTIALLPYKRVELSVNADFINGQRFALLIGARLETPEPAKYHGADGEDEYLYAVTKD